MRRWSSCIDRHKRKTDLPGTLDVATMRSVRARSARGAVSRRSAAPSRPSGSLMSGRA